MLLRLTSKCIFMWHVRYYRSPVILLFLPFLPFSKFSHFFLKNPTFSYFFCFWLFMRYVVHVKMSWFLQFSKFITACLKSKDQYSLLVVVLSNVQNMLQYVIFHLLLAPTFSSIILLFSYCSKVSVLLLFYFFVIVRWAPWYKLCHLY